MSSGSKLSATAREFRPSFAATPAVTASPAPKEDAPAAASALASRLSRLSATAKEWKPPAAAAAAAPAPGITNGAVPRAGSISMGASMSSASASPARAVAPYSPGLRPASVASPAGVAAATAARVAPHAGLAAHVQPMGSAPSRSMYTPEFLLSFRGSCTDVPEGLGEQYLVESFGRKSGGRSRRGDGKDGGDAGWQRGLRPEAKARSARGKRLLPRDLTAPPADEVEPLSITENGYRVVQVSGEEAVLKEARGILNKLTIEKFARLSTKLLNVGIRNRRILDGVVDMIVERAQKQHTFSAMYADLCVLLGSTELPDWEDEEEDGEAAEATAAAPSRPARLVLFRRLLLARCQEALEAKPDTEAWAELPEEERAEKEKHFRMDRVGLLRFVGELYCRGHIKAAVVHRVLIDLFPTSAGDPEARVDDFNIEQAVNLLEVAGPKLDDDKKSKDNMRNFFAMLLALSTDHHYESRTRFLVMDLLDLRRNNWTARRQEMAATTLDEVHRQARKEGLIVPSRSKKTRAGTSSSQGGRTPGRSGRSGATAAASAVSPASAKAASGGDDAWVAAGSTTRKERARAARGATNRSGVSRGGAVVRAAGAPAGRPKGSKKDEPAKVLASNKFMGLDDDSDESEEEEEEEHKHTFGKVPEYLVRRKLEKEEAEAKARELEERTRGCPPGMMVMPEAERLETLAALQDSYEEVKKQLGRMPLVIETRSQIKRQEALEAKLQEIEDAVKIFSRPKVFVKQD
mmetsp:Transcript_6786/g.21506  ORF Transcript_6786/g.21506 Transcript_6786/m.21506 type:complete len:748 (+) Transcript_6786:81-2324(+)